MLLNCPRGSRNEMSKYKKSKHNGFDFLLGVYFLRRDFLPFLDFPPFDFLPFLDFPPLDDCDDEPPVVIGGASAIDFNIASLLYVPIFVAISETFSSRIVADNFPLVVSFSTITTALLLVL